MSIKWDYPYHVVCDRCGLRGPGSYTEYGAVDLAEDDGWDMDVALETGGADFCPQCQE